MNSSRSRCIGRLLQSLRESGASRVLDQPLLVLPPLALALIYASYSLCLMPARALYPRQYPLTGVHGPPDTLLPLLLTPLAKKPMTAMKEMGVLLNTFTLLRIFEGDCSAESSPCQRLTGADEFYMGCRFIRSRP